MRWRRLVALAGGMLALPGCASGGLDAPPGPASHVAFGHRTAYAPVPCWFDVRARHPISCGQLVVPEDWTAAEGRQLHLPVVIFHTAQGRGGEPVVWLSGGPGGRSDLRTDLEIERWLGFLDGARWSRAHDVIVIAQRGTAWTDSDLSCPELSTPVITVSAGEAQGEGIDRRSKRREEAIACGQRLAAQGHALGAYNTAQNARDVAALRPLLGLEAWSLYGVSYGTRYALALMRDHPEGVRSAILDSPYPPQLATLGLEATGFMHALDRVLDACAADAMCRSSYPDLRRKLTAVLARLRAAPMRLPVASRDGARTVYLRVDDVEFLDALLAHLRDAELLEYVPNLIEEIDVRPEAFAAGYRELLFEEQNGPVAEGAFLSILCNDESASVGAGSWADETKRHPQLASWLLARPSLIPCDRWPVRAVDPRDRQPVVSGIPTLILAGALDPITPASYARATAATLDHAHVFEFAGISHGVLATEPCASELVAAFLAQPERRPEVTCPARDSEFSPSLNARAMALLEEGKAEEAEQLLRDLLAAQKALGPSHRNLAITLTSLGEVELRRGAYAEAEPLLKKALAVGSKTRSPYDPAIAAAALSLATVYRAQGRRDEAEPLYRRALRIEEIAWGPDHPRLLSTLEAYSDLLRELGRVREARELESRAAGIERG